MNLLHSRKAIAILVVALLVGIALAGCINGSEVQPGTQDPEPRFTISLEAQPVHTGIKVQWVASLLEESSLQRVEIHAVKPPPAGMDGEPVFHGWNQSAPPSTGSHVIELPPGQWHLAARAEDEAGRVAWSQEHTLKLPEGQSTGQEARAAGQAGSLRVNAGQDKTLHDPQGKGEVSFRLNGKSEPGPGVTILRSAWYEDDVKVADTFLTTVTRPVGAYEFTFRVTYKDGSGVGGVAEDSLRVDLRPNQPPRAVAGDDMRFRDTDGSGSVVVPLDGSRSFDPDGRIVSYTWTQGSRTLLEGAKGTVELPVGTHTLTLTVRDNGGATGAGSLKVTVNPSLAPVAVAKAQDAINLHDEDEVELTLDGSDSFHPDDLEVTITRYTWTDSTGQVVADGTASVVTVLRGDGTYSFTLKVTDGAGNTDSDTVDVTVHPQPGGPTSTFTMECTGTTCTFDASESTGHERTYHWEMGDGTQRTGRVVTHTYPAESVFTATLDVRDAIDRLASDTRTVDLRPDHPLSITSPAFGPGDEIPGRYGCQLAFNGYPYLLTDAFLGNGIHPLHFGVSPPLILTAPRGTQTLAFSVLDRVDIGNGPESFVHWIVYDIPVPDSGIVDIPEGTFDPPGDQAVHHFGEVGYLEFCTLPGLSPSVHPFEFRVYALSTTLGLGDGATLGGFQAALASNQNHVIGTTAWTANYSDKVCGVALPDLCIHPPTLD